MSGDKLVGERLRRILEDVYDEDIRLDEAHTAILALFKSIMPEAKTIPTPDEAKALTEANMSLAVEAVKFHAWNSYRTELLKLLEEK